MEVFEKAVLKIEDLGIEPIQIPYQKAPPKRFTGGASHRRTDT